MDDIEAKERVKKWLEYCDDNNIKPWEFDFKQCYIKEKIKKNASHLRLEIKYKRNLLEETNNEFNVTNEKGEKADYDKEALPMYRILGWQKSEDDQIRGESMNSFKTTFTPLMNVNVNNKNKQPCSTIYSPFSIKNNQIWKNKFKKDSIPDLYDELEKWAIDNKVEDKLKIFIKSHYNNDDGKVAIFLDDLEKFAKLTSSIGNFIVLPSWMNTGRAGGNIRDYWDLTLRDLRDFFFEIDHEHGVIVWNQFIEKYYLQPFVDEDYVPKELWEGHFENGVMPKKIEDFKQFYKNVNLLIEERGKWITKKLYEKVHSGEELNECSLYQTELANLELHYFEEATTQTQKN